MLLKTSLFRPLVPVDGGWSAWGGWGQCIDLGDSECGKTRSRTCTDPPPFGGGAPCPANQTLITMPTFSIDPSSVSVVYGNSSSPPSGSGPPSGPAPPPGSGSGSVDPNSLDPSMIAALAAAAAGGQ